MFDFCNKFVRNSLLFNHLWDRKSVHIHELRKFAKVVDILYLSSKFGTKTRKQFTQKKKRITPPNDWFEEVVDNTNKVGGMDYETSFQVLLITSI